MGIGLRGRRKRGGGRGRENGEGRRKVTPALYTGLFTLCPLISWYSNYVNVHQSETGTRIYAWLTSCGDLLCLLPSTNKLIAILLSPTSAEITKMGSSGLLPFPVYPVPFSPMSATQSTSVFNSGGWGEGDSFKIDGSNCLKFCPKGTKNPICWCVQFCQCFPSWFQLRRISLSQACVEFTCTVR